MYDFKRLTNATIYKEITMKVSESDMYVLKELVSSNIDSHDRKLLLIKYFCRLTLYKQAISILKKDLKSSNKKRK